MYVIQNEIDKEVFSGYTPSGRLMWRNFDFENTTINPSIFRNELEAGSEGNYIQEHFKIKVVVIPLQEWIDSIK